MLTSYNEHFILFHHSLNNLPYQLVSPVPSLLGIQETVTLQMLKVEDDEVSLSH